ncbi:MAG: hypothetical protein AAB229_03815, partial [Candidatus Hydrogenedentota bacterium]
GSGSYLYNAATSGATFDLRRNWYGTTSQSTINAKVTGSAASLLTWQPLRLGPVDTFLVDTVAPATPTSLTTDTSQAARVIVTWTLPVLDEEGSALTGFSRVRVYRDTNPTKSDWRADSPDFTLAATDTTWNDTTVTVGSTYYYRVTAVDTAGLENEAFFSDTKMAYVAPGTCAIATPLDNYDTNRNLITLTGTSGFTNAGDSVTVYRNGIAQSTGIVAGGGGWSCTALLSAKGDSIEARLTRLGTFMDSNKIRINFYDTPVADLLTPANDHDTNVRIVTLTGTTTLSTVGDSVAVYRNGIFQSTTAVSAGGTWSCTTSFAGRGDSVVALIVNRFNDQSRDTHRINWFDTPGVDILIPPTGHDTNIRVFTLSGTTVLTVAGDSIGVYRNGIHQSTTTVSAANTWSCTTSIAAKGDSIVAFVVNRFRNSGGETHAYNFFDTPTIDIVAPVNNHETVVVVFTISGTSTLSTAGDSVGVYRNGIHQSTTTVSAGGAWSCTTSISAVGDSVRAYITSRFLNQGADTHRFDYYDSPLIDILTPLNNHETNVRVITLTGTTALSSVGDSVGVYVNGVLQCTGLVQMGQTWSCTASLQGLADSVRVTVYNRVGGFGQDTQVIYFYDTPVVDILTPPTNHDTNVMVFTLTGTTTLTVIGDSVGVYRNGIHQSTTTVGAGGAWSCTTSVAARGDSVRALVVNRFRNMGQETHRINFHGTPVIDILTPLAGHDTNIAVIMITGTTTLTFPGDSVGVYRNGIHQSTTTVSSTGTWSCTTSLGAIGDSINARVITMLRDTGHDTIHINFYDGTVWFVNDASTVSDSFTSAIGRDTGRGDSLAPFRTIAKALSMVASNETIYVDRGTFTESVVFLVDSTAIIGVGDDTTIVDPPGESTTGGIYAFNLTGRRATLIRNVQATGAEVGFRLSNSDSSLIESSYARLNSFGVDLEGGSDSNLIRNVRAERNSAYGY